MQAPLQQLVLMQSPQSSVHEPSTGAGVGTGGEPPLPHSDGREYRAVWSTHMPSVGPPFTGHIMFSAVAWPAHLSDLQIGPHTCHPSGLPSRGTSCSLLLPGLHTCLVCRLVHTHAIRRASLHGAHHVLCCCLACTLVWSAGVPLCALTETEVGILGLESHNICRCTVSRTKGAGCIQAADVSIPCSVHICVGLDIYS